MGMTSDFTKNPVLAGNTADASKWYQSQGYKWTPNGWQRPNNYVTEPGQFGGSGGSFAFGTSSSYPDRTLPSWYPKMGEITSEAETALGHVPGAFNTSGYQRATDDALGAISTKAENAASNAAADYANRARQAGGNAESAGLIKAEGLVAGQKTLADTKIEAAKFEIEQREKAATLSSQIASNLGDLRNNYLSTLAGYASREDQIAASSAAGSGRGSGGSDGSGAWSGIIPNGMGLASGLRATAFNARTGQMSTSSNPAAGTPWQPNNFFGGG
jgi:hypothetical protein